MSENETAVSRLCEILRSQLELVSDTTEAASTNLAEKTSALYEMMSSTPEDASGEAHRSEIRAIVMDIQMTLQFQDIVRQQIDTVRAGLECFAAVDAPEGQDPEDWFLAQIARLEGAYVMQDQWDIHHAQLGIEPVAVANGDDMTLF